MKRIFSALRSRRSCVLNYFSIAPYFLDRDETSMILWLHPPELVTSVLAEDETPVVGGFIA